MDSSATIRMEHLAEKFPLDLAAQWPRYIRCPHPLMRDLGRGGKHHVFFNWEQVMLTDAPQF